MIIPRINETITGRNARTVTIGLPPLNAEEAVKRLEGIRERARLLDGAVVRVKKKDGCWVRSE